MEPFVSKKILSILSQEDDRQTISKINVGISLYQGVESFFPKPDDSTDSFHITDLEGIEFNSQLSRRKITQGPKRRRPAKTTNLAHLKTDKIKEYMEPEKTKDKKKPIFTAEALAGLKSVEDFSNVVLKTSSDTTMIYSSGLPYKSNSPMLIHIKGRRQVFARIVSPEFSSINDGDCFVLLTSNRIFSFVGKFANVIEIKVCKDFCKSVLRDKDLGCSATMLVSITGRNLDSCQDGKAFCNILKRKEDQLLRSSGHIDEDELIESCISQVDKIFEFSDNKLLPVKEFWGQQLTISITDPKKILVFDFGSEFYVWNGRNAPPNAKKFAMLLAEEMFQTTFDYTMCHLSPFSFSSICGHPTYNLKDDLRSGIKRPDFAIFGRINQNMETILFRQKFKNWPDQIRSDNAIPPINDCVSEIIQIDGEHLYKSWCYKEPNLVLENSNLGRGNFYYDEDTRKHSEVLSVSVEKWHTCSEHIREVPVKDYCHFYDTESYIIKWVYRISVNVFDLNGHVSTRKVGRNRYVYFNWQGCNASANKRGTSILHMIALDKEKGSQVIIQQFQEFPAFARLFKVMFVHEKRNNIENWRMYYVNGCDQSETVIYEVVCEFKQLRSRACLILVQGNKGKLVLWKGSKTTNHQQFIAREVCSEICTEKHGELLVASQFRLFEYCEGEESEELLSALNGSLTERKDYGSLLENGYTFDFTPKLFELTSRLSGVFEAIEVVHTLRSKQHPTAFPFVQSDLYNVRQPTIFIIDNGYTLYLWKGWWPEENNQKNRAGANRWYLECFEAIQTAINYWKTKCGEDETYRKEIYLTTAGFEPPQFQAIFPFWTVNNRVISLNSNVSYPVKSLFSLPTLFITFYFLEFYKRTRAA